MIEVKYCNIKHLDEVLIDKYLEELPDFMLQEINRYKIANDRKTRLIARLMIKEYLQKKKYAARLANWQKGENGKPFITNGPEFNITHSDEMVAVAFSDCPIGIDIEKTHEVDIEALSSYLHTEEKAYILTSKNKQDAFFTIWAKKEAYLKAAAKGIAHELAAISVIENNIINNHQHWYFKQLYIDPFYKSFICSTNEINNIIPCQYIF